MDAIIVDKENTFINADKIPLPVNSSSEQAKADMKSRLMAWREQKTKQPQQQQAVAKKPLAQKIPINNTNNNNVTTAADFLQRKKLAGTGASAAGAISAPIIVNAKPATATAATTKPKIASRPTSAASATTTTAAPSRPVSAAPAPAVANTNASSSAAATAADRRKQLLQWKTSRVANQTLAPGSTVQKPTVEESIALARLAQAVVALKEKKLEKAGSLFAQIQHHPGFKFLSKKAEYWIALAHYHEAAGQFDEVVEVFEDATRHSAKPQQVIAEGLQAFTARMLELESKNAVDQLLNSDDIGGASAVGSDDNTEQYEEEKEEDDIASPEQQQQGTPERSEQEQEQEVQQQQQWTEGGSAAYAAIVTRLTSAAHGMEAIRNRVASAKRTTPSLARYDSGGVFKSQQQENASNEIIPSSADLQYKLGFMAPEFIQNSAVKSPTAGRKSIIPSTSPVAPLSSRKSIAPSSSPVAPPASARKSIIPSPVAAQSAKKASPSPAPILYHNTSQNSEEEEHEQEEEYEEEEEVQQEEEQEYEDQEFAENEAEAQRMAEEEEQEQEAYYQEQEGYYHEEEEDGYHRQELQEEEQEMGVAEAGYDGGDFMSYLQPSSADRDGAINQDYDDGIDNAYFQSSLAGVEKAIERRLSFSAASPVVSNTNVVRPRKSILDDCTSILHPSMMISEADNGVDIAALTNSPTAGNAFGGGAATPYSASRRRVSRCGISGTPLRVPVANNPEEEGAAPALLFSARKSLAPTPSRKSVLAPVEDNTGAKVLQFGDNEEIAAPAPAPAEIVSSPAEEEYDGDSSASPQSEAVIDLRNTPAALVQQRLSRLNISGTPGRVPLSQGAEMAQPKHSSSLEAPSIAMGSFVCFSPVRSNAIKHASGEEAATGESSDCVLTQVRRSARKGTTPIKSIQEGLAATNYSYTPNKNIVFSTIESEQSAAASTSKSALKKKKDEEATAIVEESAQKKRQSSRRIMREIDQENVEASAAATLGSVYTPARETAAAVRRSARKITSSTPSRV